MPGYPWPAQPTPPVEKKNGGGRKVVGVLLVFFAVWPLMGAGALVVKEFNEAQVQVINDAFLPEAWHNMPADRFFPDRLGVVRIGVGGEAHAWARQGIDAESTCEDPGLEPKLADAVNEHGCQAVLRATYVDTTATLVTTIAVAVVGSASDAQSIGEEFDPAREHPGQLVRTLPVAGTPAEDWTDGNRVGVEIDIMHIGSDEVPYVVALTVGYVDGRPVEVLPEPWTLPAPGSANEHALDLIAGRTGDAFDEQVRSAVEEMVR